MRFMASLALLSVVACAHYTPPTEAQLALERRGDLLIDLQLRHDLGGTERYTVVYTPWKTNGVLLIQTWRGRRVTLPMSKIEELFALASSELLTAKSVDDRVCNDCTSYVAVVRVGQTVHSFSGWLAADEAEPVHRLLRALPVQ